MPEPRLGTAALNGCHRFEGLALARDDSACNRSDILALAQDEGCEGDDHERVGRVRVPTDRLDYDLLWRLLAAVSAEVEDGRRRVVRLLLGAGLERGKTRAEFDDVPRRAEAVGFEAQRPAGLARMAYWPDSDGDFFLVVESKNKKGWKRFLEHHYPPA
jgi:hypothetical protein